MHSTTNKWVLPKDQQHGLRDMQRPTFCTHNKKTITGTTLLCWGTIGRAESPRVSGVRLESRGCLVDSFISDRVYLRQTVYVVFRGEVGYSLYRRKAHLLRESVYLVDFML